MKQNELNQDEELKKAIQRIHDNIEVPDYTSSWLKVQTQLNKRKQRKLLKRRWKTIAIIAACSFIGSIVISTSIPTVQAQISSLLKRMQNQVIEFFHEEPGAAPPETSNNNGSHNTSKNTHGGNRMEELTLQFYVE